jgi:cell division protein FtsQ
MSPVAVSADRRFHRAHVKPARRRAIWRSVAVGVAKYAVVLAVGVYGASEAVTFARQSPLLAVAQIRTAGNQRLSAEEIRARLAGLGGENILLTDLDGWRTRLLESPWVRDASLRRTLPSTIEVTIKERQPIAIGRVGGRLYLVDEHGGVIDEYAPQYANLDLPIVDGFSGSTPDDGADDARGALAARIIMALKQKPEIASRLSQVDVSDVHNASVLLTDDPAELRIGEDRFLERVESYLSLSSALRERVADIDYVDLRFDGRVYVRPAGKAGRASVPLSGRPDVSRAAAVQH